MMEAVTLLSGINLLGKVMQGPRLWSPYVIKLPLTSDGIATEADKGVVNVVNLNGHSRP